MMLNTHDKGLRLNIFALPFTMQSHLLLTTIAIFFAALWLPFGQQPYLYDNWMTIGLYGAGFLLMGALSFQKVSGNPLFDLKFLHVLLFVAYLFHQYEEHGTDLLGRHYAFMPAFNAILASVVPECGGSLACPLNPEAIFAVNTGIVWLIMALALWGGVQFPFVGLCAAAGLLINAIAHIAEGIVFQEYNAGLMTAVVLFIPLSLFYFKTAIPTLQEPQSGTKMVALGIAQGYTSRVMLATSLVWAVLAHVLLGSLAIGIYVYHLLPQPFYLILLVVWSLVPLLGFHRQQGEEIVVN